MTGAEVLHAHENKFLGVYGVDDRMSVLLLRGRDAIFPASSKNISSLCLSFKYERDGFMRGILLFFSRFFFCVSGIIRGTYTYFERGSVI